MIEATKLKKNPPKDSAANDADVDTSEENPAESDTPGKGHNSDKLKQVIVQCAVEMVDVDAVRKDQNRIASDIRQVLDDHGIDKEAFKEAYAYRKKKHHERDGFDESSDLCHEALGDPKQKDLFDILKDAA